jgi:voltage-gated potassium channel
MSPAEPPADPRRSLAVALELFGPYELYMLALSLFSLGILAADILLPLGDSAHQVLTVTDTVLCGLFLLDFGRNLWRAPDRLRYLIRGGWLDLASSIPTIDWLRIGRLSRIARIVRLLRAMRSARTIGTIISRHRKESVLLAAAVVCFVLMVFASLAILQFETDPESNIRSGGDAVWWAFATITTVGYGDRYPVTLEGRFVASILMAAGVGLFGILSGLVASWFLSGTEEEKDDRIDHLVREIAGLREEMRLRDLIGPRSEDVTTGS